MKVTQWLAWFFHLNPTLKIYCNYPQIPVRFYSVISIHGPIKGQLQAEEKIMCFIASILKFMHFGALIYSWSMEFHTGWCPCSNKEACGTDYLTLARFLWGSFQADSRAWQPPWFCNLEDRGTDGQEQDNALSGLLKIPWKKIIRIF